MEDRSFCNRRIESNSFFFFFCSSTVNLVINLFFELCSFLYKNCCLSFYSFLTLLLRIYAFNNIEIVLLIKIQCSSERALLSALSPGEKQAKRCASKCYSRKPVHFATQPRAESIQTWHCKSRFHEFLERLLLGIKGVNGMVYKRLTTP